MIQLLQLSLIYSNVIVIICAQRMTQQKSVHNRRIHQAHFHMVENLTNLIKSSWLFPVFHWYCSLVFVANKQEFFMGLIDHKRPELAVSPWLLFYTI